MKLSWVVMFMLAATAARPGRANADEWTVEPPAGWVANAELAKRLREQSKADCPVKSEAAVWVGPADSRTALLVQFCVLGSRGKPWRTLIGDFDREMMKAVAKSAGGTPAGDKPERIEGNLVIRDSMIALPSVQMQALRRYQPASDGLHVLSVTCVAPKVDVCGDSLEKSSLVIASPVALDADDGDGVFDRNHKIGIVIGILIALGVFVVIANKRKQRA